MKPSPTTACCPLRTLAPAVLSAGRRPGHAFSGPPSRRTRGLASASPRQHLGAPQPLVDTRMGPAPACPNRLPHRHRAPGEKGSSVLPAGWRWRLWAQAPFACQREVWRHPGVDATALVGPRAFAASVGRRTHVTPPPCPHAGRGERTATGSKLNFAGVDFSRRPARSPGCAAARCRSATDRRGAHAPSGARRPGPGAPCRRWERPSRAAS
jgi:hypothetical protein